jgi:hypothetical protein
MLRPHRSDMSNCRASAALDIELPAATDAK